MEHSKELLLQVAFETCNEEEKPVEHTLQFMQDFAGMEREDVLRFINNRNKKILNSPQE